MCFAQGQGQKREQKPTTKNFVEFYNHSPRLTNSRARENERDDRGNKAHTRVKISYLKLPEKKTFAKINGDVNSQFGFK